MQELKVLVGIAAVLLAGCIHTKVSGIPDPHGHYGQVHLAKSSNIVMKDVHFELISGLPTERTLYTKNHTGNKAAFVSYGHVPYVSYEPELFCVVDYEGNLVHRLLNPHFPHRPVSEINWLTENLVCFDVWTGPHFGVHYVVDAIRYKVLHAVHFHDEFIEGLEKGIQPPAGGDAEDRAPKP